MISQALRSSQRFSDDLVLFFQRVNEFQRVFINHLQNPTACSIQIIYIKDCKPNLILIDIDCGFIMDAHAIWNNIAHLQSKSTKKWFFLSTLKINVIPSKLVIRLLLKRNVAFGLCNATPHSSSKQCLVLVKKAQPFF